jgi:hypothetical protein
VNKWSLNYGISLCSFGSRLKFYPFPFEIIVCVFTEKKMTPGYLQILAYWTLIYSNIYHKWFFLASFVSPCASLGLSATSQHYFSLTTNQPLVTSQQYFSLRTNQHQPNEQAECS